jgi:folate-binding protein YgfZ
VSSTSPLLSLHRDGNALLSPYGPSTGPAPEILLVEAFDPVEIEYASIRTHAAVFDMPHRATIAVSGPDALPFLNRMLTQELKGLPHFETRPAFWLNRKGRIDADLRLLHLPDRILLDVDVHAAERARAGLDSFIVADDCQITDETGRWHRISLHGPASASILAKRSKQIDGAPTADIKPRQISRVIIAGVEVIVDRQDLTGEIGLNILIPAEGAEAVYEAISEKWPEPGATPRAIQPAGKLARRIGWHALNIARIEAGSAMYLVDFGPDSLPHETGAETLADRVSFKKGCYLGQEVVARMQALGHPKQRLVGLRIEAPEGAQAVTGTRLLAADEAAAPEVGAVTSSCMSPMLGQAHIAFAMAKWSHAQEGSKVWAAIDERRVSATARESLIFWKR